MKKLILSTAVLALSAGAVLAQDVVRIGTEGAYPPFHFINDAGEIDGFDRELGDALCERAELTCEWVINDWDSIIPNLVSGNYDAIIAGMSITAERDEVIDFSQNYTLPDPSAYAVATGNEGLDVESAVIAAQTNTIQSAFVAEMGATLVEYATPDETIAAVRSGEADAVLADKTFLSDIVDSDAELTFLERTELIGGGQGIGMRESDTDLQAAFNAAIDSMKADGSLNALITKWEVGETF